MTPQHHTFLQWLNHNWAVISLVWFPAFICYLRAFVDSCKVVGWTKLADELGKLELFLTTFVAAVKSQNKTLKSGNTDLNPVLFFAGFFLCFGIMMAISCMSAGVQGNGVDVFSPVYGHATANSINGEINAGI